ncbi:signal recognition particle subunit srp68 [Coemansia sp. RSA 2711]|nr:signal recognition particle subunit srp68 [Coemansia sp. RSA 2711]
MAPISFDIFGYIHEARQAHGLRAQDYTRYRRFCATHLRTVRKAAGLSQGTATGFHKRPVDGEVANSGEHVEIQLLLAERAWAYAMDLREQHSRTEEPRQLQHVVRRLRAGSKAAQQLARIAPGFCDVRTGLAAAAYWLQLQSQLRFEQQEWEAALDSAALARVIVGQLAQGSSQQYALSHAMLEALDPVVRLAAYRTRMPGAQQAQPATIATQWYETSMQGGGDRVSTTIPEYRAIVAALDSLSEAGDAVFANELGWRGGKVTFASPQLAALASSAQTQLAAALDNNNSGMNAAVAGFRKVEKAAQRCYAESAAAALKTQSAASDALTSAYLAVRLYSVCALNAMAVGKRAGEAQRIARACGVEASAAADASVGRLVGQWGIAAAGRPQAAELTKLVVCYDQIRARLATLRAIVGETHSKLSTAASREVRAPQLGDEVAAAEAYYACVRGYYSAMLHAAHARHRDALALLDATAGESARRARELVAELATRGQSRAEALAPADRLWAQWLGVSADDVARIAAAAEAAMPVVRGLCAGAGGAAGAWIGDPSRPPAMVANPLAAAKTKAGGASAPARVPWLVDFDAELQPVPAKPLFYDLAAAAIDFDMDAIEARAGKPGSSKLGSIIGSLWGAR